MSGKTEKLNAVDEPVKVVERSRIISVKHPGFAVLASHAWMFRGSTNKDFEDKSMETIRDRPEIRFSGHPSTY
jgi:hypothetical protein